MGENISNFRHGTRKYLVLSTQEIRPRLQELPLLLQQTRYDPEVRPQHVPSVLQGIREGHRLQEVGLNERTRKFTLIYIHLEKYVLKKEIKRDLKKRPKKKKKKKKKK